MFLKSYSNTCFKTANYSCICNYTFSENLLVSFSSKIIQVDTDETKHSDENNEYVLINYSDSIVYTQRNSKWVGKLKTPKDKVFRTETKKFDEYYKN